MDSQRRPLGEPGERRKIVMKRTVTTMTLGAGAAALALICAAPVQAQPSEDTVVWRAQVRFRTCDSEHGGTNNSVRVSLNRSNFTWLDHPGHDFGRNDIHSYDLRLDNLATLDDITRLRVRKTGSDGWCIESVSLLINNQRIFRDTQDRTLDNDNGHSLWFTINRDTLRANASWEDWVDPTTLPMTLSRRTIEHRIIALVGDGIHGTALEWNGLDGDRYVRVSRLDADELHVEVELEADDGFFYPDADIEFDLRFSCADEVISITPRDFEVTVYWPLDEDDANDILDAFRDAVETVPFPVPLCPDITIQDDGDVVFDL